VPETHVAFAPEGASAGEEEEEEEEEEASDMANEECRDGTRNLETDLITTRPESKALSLVRANEEKNFGLEER